jgi:glycosyltransferase involved in cell wall biosynthesis
MNILLLNTNNPLKDSGIVAFDLFNQLKNRNHEVKLLVNSYSNSYPDGIISMESSFSASRNLFISKFTWRINKLKSALNIKKQNRTDTNYFFLQLNEKKLFYKTKTILRKARIKPDIIIILFAKNFINSKNIYELFRETHAKIFWLMYDMAPFTGGCHYAWDCTGYQKNCGSCPALFSSDQYDASYKNLIYKKSFLDKTEIQILAGSEWQYAQTKMSTLFRNKPVHKMLLPIDSSVFKPADKIKLREMLKISPDKKVIFFGAVGLSEKRKGMQYLIESLNKLKEIVQNRDPDLGENILLLVAGKGLDSIASLIPFESLHMGYLDNKHGIASAYQTADLFLCPSIEDSGPMMINQSIMCGTPVVSFEMGVSVDIVITGETGYRAKLRNSDDLAQGIYNILKMNSVDYNKLSEQCRALALRLYSPEIWMEILEKLIGNDVSL